MSTEENNICKECGQELLYVTPKFYGCHIHKSTGEIKCESKDEKIPQSFISAMDDYATGKLVDLDVVLKGEPPPNATKFHCTEGEVHFKLKDVPFTVEEGTPENIAKASNQEFSDTEKQMLQEAWDKMQEDSKKIPEHTPLDVLENKINSELEEVLKERRKLVHSVLVSDRKVDKLIIENQQLKLELAQLTTDYNILKDKALSDSRLTTRQRADKAIELYLLTNSWAYDENKGYLNPKDGTWYASCLAFCCMLQNCRDDMELYKPNFGGYCIGSEALSKNNIKIRDHKAMKDLC